MKDLYFDKQGQPIDSEKWRELLKGKDYKIIKQTELENGKWVSTVWFGLNHNLGEGKPLIFETMVFPEKGKYSDLDCERYSTLEEALKGHEEMIKKWE